MRRAIVLLNMGGPNNLDEVKVFLSNMFNDHRIISAPAPIRKIISWIIIAKRLKEAQHNYSLLGGKSPLMGYTQKIVDALKEKTGDDVFAVMRYTPPFAKDVLPLLKEYDEIIALPMYPHYSSTTTASSMDDLMSVAKGLGIENKIKTLDSYYRDELYNQAIVERIKEALAGRDPSTIDMVFSAHGLPQKVIDRGDVYQKHIKGNLFFVRKELLRQGIRFRKTHLAYQSRLGPMEWIRPYLEDKLETLKNRDVIIYPLAFTADNSETECELDIEYREKSEHIPLASYTVAKTVNDHPLFIEELSHLARNL